MSLQLSGSPGRPCSRPGRAPSRTAPAATSGTTRICPGRCTGKVRALPPRAPGSAPARRCRTRRVPGLPGEPPVSPVRGNDPTAGDGQSLRGGVCAPPVRVFPQVSAGCLRNLLSFSVCHFFFVGKRCLLSNLLSKKPSTFVTFPLSCIFFFFFFQNIFWVPLQKRVHFQGKRQSLARVSLQHAQLMLFSILWYLQFNRKSQVFQ